MAELRTSTTVHAGETKPETLAQKLYKKLAKLEIKGSGASEALFLTFLFSHIAGVFTVSPVAAASLVLISSVAGAIVILLSVSKGPRR